MGDRLVRGGGWDEDTVVKYDIHSDKAGAVGLLAVANDAAIELIDFLEAFLEHPRGELFAADAAGAVGEDALAFELLAVGENPSRKIAEALERGQERALEMAELALVVIAAVEKDDIILLNRLAPLFGRKVPAGFLVDRGAERDAHRDDLVAHLDAEPLKDMPLDHIDFELNFGEDRTERFHVRLACLSGAAHRPIDSLCRDDDPPPQAKFLAL